MSAALDLSYKEFENRHDFDSDALSLLRRRFMNTFFGAIPEAWVIPLDEMLEKVYEKDPFMIRSIDQHFGFLGITFRRLQSMSDDIEKLIKQTEKRLYDIDVDLHEAIKQETNG